MIWTLYCVVLNSASTFGQGREELWLSSVNGYLIGIVYSDHIGAAMCTISVWFGVLETVDLDLANHCQYYANE